MFLPLHVFIADIGQYPNLLATDFRSSMLDSNTSLKTVMNADPPTSITEKVWDYGYIFTKPKLKAATEITHTDKKKKPLSPAASDQSSSSAN